MPGITKYRPRVPSAPSLPGPSSGRVTRGRGATSNHWELTNCHLKLNIATYNIQSLSSDDRLYELETELNKIKWDIVGLCEVRRPGEELMTLQSGNTLYYREGPRPGVGGIGFIDNKNLKNAVIEINSVSDRVAYLKLKLSSMYELALKQIYAYADLYITNHTDDEVEEFYDDVSSVKDKVKTLDIFGTDVEIHFRVFKHT